MVMYDEYWDITDMLIKLEIQTSKSLINYYLPSDKNLSQKHESSKLPNYFTISGSFHMNHEMFYVLLLEPPDHITHKLLPKATAFIIFAKGKHSFLNMLDTMGQYPWWNKRARFIILTLDKSVESTTVRAPSYPAKDN
jgi:hypothetical protein